MIPWRRIAELPDELKDGREVLVTDGPSTALAWWTILGWEYCERDERNPYGLRFEPTHFAEITPP